MDLELTAIAAMRSVVLVEGRSDKAALEALATRRGRALSSEGVAIVAMSGATNIGRFLTLLGPRGLSLTLSGLCDAAEEDHFRRALGSAGLGPGLSRDGMEAAGFYVCTADLEEELIRALGVTAVERIIRSQGELRALRTFQNQPAHRGSSSDVQLHRFMGTRSGRKSQYARLLTQALDLAKVPRPLDSVLAHAGGPPE